MDLTAPLLSSQPSDPAHHIVTVDHKSTTETSDDIRSPFEFLGINHPLLVPATSSLNPFRNHTERIEGLYEWVKITICVLIVVVRLVIFGLAILVGFIATKTALEGWKDKQNPMLKWRFRVMWITRI